MRPALFLYALCGMLAACALIPDQQASRANPAALVDAYLVAHGMAASYAESPGADADVVIQLAKLDARAADAVRSLVRVPESGRSATATASAIAALTDYAARQTIVSQ